MANPDNRLGPHNTPQPSPASGEAAVKTTGRALKPKDAATLVLVDRSQGERRVLMGRRQSTQVFLPNKFVFPGGRVDRGDRTMVALTELSAADQEWLLRDMKGPPSAARIRALALAAVRETFEEAGLIVGTRLPEPCSPGPLQAPQGAKPDAKLHAAKSPPRPTHKSWQQFLATGYLPSLSELTFFARAITPPARPRRYDTRFFLADASAVAHNSDNRDDELRELGWFTLDEIRSLELPNITRAIVEDLAQRLDQPDRNHPIPYYRFERGSFRRDLIT